MPTERLLIVEDDPHVAKIMRLIAQSSGLDIRSATDAAEFFRVAAEWEPTHIALDLIIPDTDSEQVLVEMARRGCSAKIIITSGVGERVLEAARRTAIRHGLNIIGVLAKPFSTAALRDLLRGGTSMSLAGANVEALQPSVSARSSVMPTCVELERAIDRQELHLLYQPKIRCSSGQMVGLEVLVRWSHPQRGELPAGDFIFLFERYGLIDRLTECVIAGSLEWYSHYREDAAKSTAHERTHARHGTPSLSINISATNLVRPNFLEDLMTHCSRHRIPGESLIFDLTETSLMDSAVGTIRALKQMRSLGFRFSMDDFGNGQSSIRRLVGLPISELKINKSFVMSTVHSSESRKLVTAIVNLGRNLGVASVATGIENVESLEYMREIGCDLAQGYAIAPPMAGRSVRSWEQLHSN